MKILVLLVVVALVVIAALLFFGGGSLEVVAPTKQPGPPAATPGPQDFRAVTALLEKDLNNVPTTLETPAAAPASAFGIKARLAAAPNPRQEYQVLARACELIIHADQEHDVRRGSDQMEQATAGAAYPARHAKAQADWANYRQQTDGEVKRLLASVQGAKW